MILLFALAAAVVWALATGGSLASLARVPIRLGWLVLAAFLLQALLVYSPAREPTLPLAAALLLSHLAVLAFVYLNRRLPGLPVLGLGFIMNALVMTLNGGFMPISGQAYERAFAQEPPPIGARPPRTKDVLLPRSQTVLWPLSDIFVLDERFPVQAVFSPGDVLISLGALLFLNGVTKDPRWNPQASRPVGG